MYEYKYKITQKLYEHLYNLPIAIMYELWYNIDSERESEHPKINGSLSCDYDTPDSA